ncbi:hypothetical protein LMG28138_05550 [Pararobbsia alpina]|uniref:Uncharacterized protein n=1 Tax=Pararobbsia alpina TaxID=621374 RepID=A0A6S7BVM2_9BURK|nr:hypothetical protein LMG28138_05550 [Pararobbsia alpina]
MPIESFAHARFHQLLCRELPVGGRRGMCGQRLRVSDIDEPREQLEGILETRPTRTAALDTEGQDARCLARQILGDERVIRMIDEARMVDPFDLGMRCRWRAMRTAFSVIRSTRKPSVSMPWKMRNTLNGEIAAPVLRKGTTHARPIYAAGPEHVSIDDTVIADVGLVEPAKALLVLSPWKLARIYDRTTQARAVATEILGKKTSRTGTCECSI